METNEVMADSTGSRATQLIAPTDDSHQLFGQTFFRHLKRDDNTIFLPIGGNRTSQLGSHSPLNKLAAKSPSPRGRYYYRRAAPLRPNHNDFALVKRARYIERAGCG